MGIIVSGNIITDNGTKQTVAKVAEAPVKTTSKSLADIVEENRKRLEEESRQQKIQAVREARQRVRTNIQQVQRADVIKPKYLEDKSVFYKPSGYLNDLLGEGN